MVDLRRIGEQCHAGAGNIVIEAGGKQAQAAIEIGAHPVALGGGEFSDPAVLHRCQDAARAGEQGYGKPWQPRRSALLTNLPIARGSINRIAWNNLTTVLRIVKIKLMMRRGAIPARQLY